MQLMKRLEALADEWGLIGLGVCGPEPFSEVRASLQAARSEGRSAGLSFTFADPATSSAPLSSFPWAQSIVVSGYAYLPGAGSPGPPRAGTGRVARFATEDHYEPLRQALTAMAAELESAGHRSEVVCDDNRLVDRAVAVRSGIAWWGKSTMALTPGAGPWFLIGSVVTSARLPRTAGMVRDCGTCEACLPACPTGALVAPGVLDARRCLAAALQLPGEIPVELRRPMGDRWYGCDECLTACPPGRRLLESSGVTDGRIDLLDVLRTADAPLRARFEHFYVPRNRARYLRRNAIVALGNAPDDDSDLVLAGYLGAPDPILRSHAAWALGQVGGPRASAALRYAASQEGDPVVRAEIEAALGTLG